MENQNEKKNKYLLANIVRTFADYYKESVGHIYMPNYKYSYIRVEIRVFKQLK